MARKITDLTGRRFGNLYVIGKSKDKCKNGSIKWICECDCGNKCIVRGYHLQSGNTKSCGHDKLQVDLTGERFDRLTVIEKVGEKEKDGNTRWLCECDCGNRCIVRADHLKSGNTQSCGCKAYRNLEPINKRIVRIYAGMKQRCYNQNSKAYKDYGGRGIKICDEWLENGGCRRFYEWAIVNGYREDLTIDRIDNNGNYEPSNCRWADWETQGNNKRTSVRVLYEGREITVKELSRITGASKYTIYQARKGGKTDFTDWKPKNGTNTF